MLGLFARNWGNILHQRHTFTHQFTLIAGNMKNVNSPFHLCLITNVLQNLKSLCVLPQTGFSITLPFDFFSRLCDEEALRLVGNLDGVWWVDGDTAHPSVIRVGLNSHQQQLQLEETESARSNNSCQQSVETLTKVLHVCFANHTTEFRRNCDKTNLGKSLNL